MSPSDYYECHTTHPQDNNQEADYLAIFINLHLSSWIKQRPGRRLEIVGGGNVRSYIIGANYSANRFVQFMLDYTYIRLTKDFLPYDKNFHSVQARVQFVF